MTLLNNLFNKEYHFWHNSEKNFWKFEDDYGVSIVALSNTWEGYSAPINHSTWSWWWWIWWCWSWWWWWWWWWWRWWRRQGWSNTWGGYSAPFNNSEGPDGSSEDQLISDKMMMMMKTMMKLMMMMIMMIMTMMLMMMMMINNSRHDTQSWCADIRQKIESNFLSNLICISLMKCLGGFRDYFWSWSPPSIPQNVLTKFCTDKKIAFWESVTCLFAPPKFSPHQQLSLYYIGDCQSVKKTLQKLWKSESIYAMVWVYFLAFWLARDAISYIFLVVLFHCGSIKIYVLLLLFV